MGERLWERFIPIYLEKLDASIYIIGAFGFLQNLLNAFWALPGGYLSDSLGYKKSFFIFSILAIAGYAIAIIFTNWIAVFFGMIFFSAWSAVSLPGTMSFITKSLGRERSAFGVSLHSVIRRIPMTLGPLAGAFLITQYGFVDGIRICFTLSMALCFVGLFFLKNLDVENNAVREKIHPMRLWKKQNTHYKNLLISDILIRFCEQIPYVFVVVWCLNIVKINAGQFGVLTAIEMIIAALIYFPVAKFSDKTERKPFVVITFVFFTLFPFALYFSNSYPLLILSFILRGLKEFGEPTRKALIVELSLKGTESRSFGLYYFIRDSIVAFAALAGGFLWSISPEVNLFTAAITGLIGTLFYIFFGKSNYLNIETVKI